MCCLLVKFTFRVAGVFLTLGLVVNTIGFFSPFWSDRGGNYEGLWHVCSGASCRLTVYNEETSSNLFRANQTVQTIGICLALAAVVSSFVISCICCTCERSLAVFVAIKTLVAGVLLLIGLVIYGVEISSKYKDVKFLFAFWMTGCAGLLYLLAGMLYAALARRCKIGTNEDDDAAADAEAGAKADGDAITA